MYPILFRIGSFEITSFGLMVGLGAVFAAWLFTRELEARGLGVAGNLALVGLIAGMAGAKLLWVGEHFGEESTLELLTSRGGLSWFGGLVGGVGAGLAVAAYRRWPLLPLLAATAPAVAVGQALGRIGCFLVGDDYGLPTSLPWGVAFPKGLPPTSVPVHPTQLYEATFLALLAWLLVRWRRHGLSDRVQLALYCLLAGAFRFLLEFVRTNVRVAAGLTVAQCASVLLVLAGVVLLVWSRGGVTSSAAVP